MTPYRLAAPALPAVVFLLLAFPPAGAQRDTAAASPTVTRTRALCWRPRPAPRCRAYLVTEFAYERAVISSRPGGFEPRHDFGGRFVWTIGPMVNRGPTAAWGGVLSVATDEVYAEGAGLLRAEVRHRRWLDRTYGVEFSAGVSQKVVRTQLRESARAYGLTAAIGVDQGFVGADARIDALYGAGRPRAAALLGIRTGSYVAPLATSAVALVGLRSMPD